MFNDTERIVTDTPPTPEQLHKLASIGMSSAAARERILSRKEKKRAHFVIDELDLLLHTAQDSDEPSQVRHRIAMRVGAYPASRDSEKQWTLKYADTYSVEATPGIWTAERSTYRFEWTRSKILLAKRTIQLFGVDAWQGETVEDELDHFHLRDDSAEILHASNQFETLTSDDCDELMRDMSEYFGAIDAINRS